MNSWHDVDDPGVFLRPAQQSQSTQTETEEEPARNNDPEVRLSNGNFVIPDGGVDFNDKCTVRADVEFLRETPRKRVTFKLFSTYDGQSQDMNCTVDGYVKEDVAEAEVTLFYNETYYDGMESNPDATVEYFFKASHPKAEAEVESARLTMPYNGKRLVLSFTIPEGIVKTDLDGDTYTLFSTDEAKSYNRRMKVKDAVSSDQSTWELHFNGLSETLTYSLEVKITGQNDAYRLFEGLTFQQMGGAS